MVFAVGAFTWPHFHTLLHFFFPPVSSPYAEMLFYPCRQHTERLDTSSTWQLCIAGLLKSWNMRWANHGFKTSAKLGNKWLLYGRMPFQRSWEQRRNKLGTPDNQDKSTENFSKEWCCEFLRSAVFCASLRSLKLPGRHRTALQDLSSKLYPCHYKTEFCPHKGHLPIAAATGR